jgi:hypothetical protein
VQVDALDQGVLVLLKVMSGGQPFAEMPGAAGRRAGKS